MHIRDWPHEERPREKLLARGAGSLSDAELLAIFLGSGLHGRDAVATARELLAQHGPLRALLERPPSELTTLPGLGPARACALAGALELGNRLLHASLERGDAISDPEAAGRYFAQRLRGRRQEVFAALGRLQDHVIPVGARPDESQLSHGPTIGASAAYPAEHTPGRPVPDPPIASLGR